MGEYEKREYFGVEWRVFVVNSLEEGIAAIQRGEEAVKFNWQKVKIGPDGAKKVAAELKNNRTLKLLDLFDNKIGPEGAGSLAEALKVNSTLTELHLRANKIGDAGAGSLAEALKVNSTLTYLNLRHNEIRDQGAGSLAEALKVNSTLTTLSLLGNNGIDNDALVAQIDARLEENKKNAQLKTKKEREELERHFVAALENGDLQEWGRVKLMLVGEGRAGKTSTVRSLLGMEPKDTDSTEGIDLKMIRTSDWTERPANVSDFDLLAGKAAASRAKKKTTPSKKPSFSEQVRKSIRKSLKRISRRQEQKSQKRESLRPEELVPSQPPRRKLVEDHDVAKRFDFEAVKAMTTKTDTGSEVSFSIWDYGGQEVFYALHHIFLSKEGVYLLVFDMTKLVEKDAEAIEFVEFWLNSVKLHAPKAPILIVGTRGDQVSSPKQHKEINRVLREELRVTEFNVTKNENLFFFPVDNSDKSPNRAVHLRTAVQEAASKLRCVNKMIPLAWLKVLDDLIVSEKQYESLELVLSLAAEYGVSSQQADEMLRTFHELGVLVHQRATERLYSTVVIEPQWLLNKLAKVINDERHSEGIFFDSALEESGLENDLAEYRRSGVATRELLEFLWKDEQVGFLLDFMKETMLLCDFQSKGKIKYLVTSLMVQERDDKPLDLEEFEGGLSCALDFSEFFLPKGVFQRLVSTCASFGFQEPELSRKQAVVHLDEDPVAFIEEKNLIRICLLEDTENGPETLKRLVSMFREQRELLMDNLPWKLLLQSPKKKVFVAYEDLLAARQKGAEKVKPEKTRKQVAVADFDPFFEEGEIVGRLDSDGDGAKVLRFRMKKLSEGSKHHVFISHKQATAGDMAGVLAAKLEARGLSVWYDQSTAGNLAEPEMKRGIREAKCYLLLLTKGVFESAAVCMELRTAMDLGKPILLVHETQTNMAGFEVFSHYISTCPEDAKHLFKEVESMPFQRRKYLADPFYEELIKRIDQSDSR